MPHFNDAAGVSILAAVIIQLCLSTTTNGVAIASSSPATAATTAPTTLSGGSVNSSLCPAVFPLTHTACLTRSANATAPMGVTSADIAQILVKHNQLRALPNATNMQAMYWDDTVAYVAEKWAENCQFQHDTQRNIPNLYPVGQNLACGYATWSDAIQAWYDEVRDFTYGDPNYVFSKIGHYTQLVWSSSVRLGCGVATCTNLANRKFYVCNYAPAGNVYGSIQTPYANGTRCAACPNKCKNSLCDCGGLVCKNGGTLNLNTCTCSCPTLYAGQPDCNPQTNTTTTTAATPGTTKMTSITVQATNVTTTRTTPTTVQTATPTTTRTTPTTVQTTTPTTTRTTLSTVQTTTPTTTRTMPTTVQTTTPNTTRVTPTTVQTTNPTTTRTTPTTVQTTPTTTRTTPTTVQTTTPTTTRTTVSTVQTTNATTALMNPTIVQTTNLTTTSTTPTTVQSTNSSTTWTTVTTEQITNSTTTITTPTTVETTSTITNTTVTTVQTTTPTAARTTTKTTQTTTPTTTRTTPKPTTTATVTTKQTTPTTTRATTTTARTTVTPMTTKTSPPTTTPAGGSVNKTLCPAVFPLDHTACLKRSAYAVSPMGVTSADKAEILAKHNQIRALTNATDMQAMYWDDAVAYVAEKWAENCQDDIDRHKDMPGVYSVGQNIGSGYTSWSNAIQDWYNEVSKFKYGDPDYSISAYTQVVWSSSVRIGCGFSTCTNLYYKKLYVCNYTPGGNIYGSTPYIRGAKCASCPNSCRNSLCDCGGLVCQNGGTIDLNTCTCTCRSPFTGLPDCKLNCTGLPDPSYCGKPQPFGYPDSFCETCDDVRSECPIMCGICPAVGKK